MSLCAECHVLLCRLYLTQHVDRHATCRGHYLTIHEAVCVHIWRPDRSSSSFSMTCLRSIDGLLKRNSLPVNVAVNMLLMLICLVSYAALFALYFSQGHEHQPYFIHPRQTLHSTSYGSDPADRSHCTLTSATSALLIRFVEHSLWETILRDRSITPTGRSLTPEDTSQQAQCLPSRGLRHHVWRVALTCK